MEPYLIQRGKFKVGGQPTGLDAIIQFDYMGSAEFEFGALPDSLKVITSNLKFFALHDSEIKCVDGRKLCFLAGHDQFELVKEFLQKLSVSKNEYKDFHLKEGSYLKDALNQTKWDGKLSYAAETEFWWDIENHWMASLGEDKANLLLKALEALRNRWKEQGKI